MMRPHRTALRALPALLLVLTAPSVAADTHDEDPWWEALRQAVERARSVAYEAETIWIHWERDRPHVSIGEVEHGAGGPLVMESAGKLTVRLDAVGGQVVNHGQGWAMPLPGVVLSQDPADVEALTAKYRIELAGSERVLDRICTLLEIVRRSDDSLRERLWFDARSGLLLRRERYEGDQLLGVGAFLSLEMEDPVGPPRRAPLQASRDHERIEERSQDVVPVGARGLEALRAAGWFVPDRLPGGYEPRGRYAMSAGDSQPLQLVYSDGLYAVSLFQQHGTLDWDSLPPGAQPVDELNSSVYEWPGAVPRRLVWEASGSTFTLVGDAPPREFMAIAAALPTPRPPGMLERLGRGLGRLWTWMSR